MRLKLTLEYDGIDFHGWAAQPGLRTVEGQVRAALERVFPRWSELAVAGRTDTGVHARGQVVSVEVDGGPPPERAPGALNAELPEDVSVIGIDDHEMAEFFELTTVAQPVHEQGQLAATLLLEALDDGLGGPAHPRAITVPTRLVVRRTTAPPP